MKSLGRDQLLAYRPPSPKAVEVPELGGTLHVRMIDGQQREQFEDVFVGPKNHNIRASMLAFALCDEAGNRIFTDEDILEHNAIGTINSWPASALMRLHDASMEFNKITREDIEELAGN